MNAITSAVRVEQIGNATLYLGDCREMLSTIGHVDTLICDPPYGIGFKYRTYDDTRSNLSDLIETAVKPAITKVTRAAITPGQTQVWMYPEADWISAVAWDTTGTFGHCGYSQWMPLLIYGKDVSGFGRNASGYLKSDVIRFTGGAGVGFQRSGDDQHPCPKPENVMRAIVARFTEPNDVVFDPFMGSGTTGVSAVRLGRSFVGIEKDPAYFALAVERLSEAQRQQDMFVAPKEDPSFMRTSDLFNQED